MSPEKEPSASFPLFSSSRCVEEISGREEIIQKERHMGMQRVPLDVVPHGQNVKVARFCEIRGPLREALCS